MTWDEFKNAVDAKLAAEGKDGDVEIDSIDVDYREVKFAKNLQIRISEDELMIDAL